MGLSEQSLQDLAEAAYVGVLTTDEQLKINGWNRWLEKNTGIVASEVLDRSLLDVFPELLTRRLERYYRQALSGQMILLAQRLHGYLLPVSPRDDTSGFQNMQQSARIAPILEKGRVVGTITMIEDVTERVVHETALRARAREQAAVASLSQRALAGGELDALLKETTTTLADVFRVEESQVVMLQTEGKRLTFQSPPDSQSSTTLSAPAAFPPGLDSLATYTLVRGEAVIVDNFDAETRFPVADLSGELSMISAASVPILSGKTPVGVLIVFKRTPRAFTAEDVRVLQSIANMLGFTIERRHLEHQLRQRADDLAEEARRKDEFLAMLAHELRNPLAPIRNAVQIIRMAGSTNPSVHQASEIVDRQVQQMVRLVDDLLDVSRISRGKVELRWERVDLATIVLRAVESVRPLVDRRKHTLTVTIAPRPIWLDGDPTRLIQILTNLLNNAAKYTDTQGQIWLTAAREGDEAVIRVRDSGIGIREDLLPQIFDLFVQSDRAMDRSEGGLGIGLTLARRLVEMHHGTLTASSEGTGLGSEFAVRLPAQPSDDDAKITLSTKPPTSRIPVQPGRRILVVDDNVDSACSLALLLRLHGHEVRVAHDGRAALGEVVASPPEIVFLDIGLPGMDGYEVARLIRNQYGPEAMVLVAMTGYGQQDDRRQSQVAGFNGHLVKPAEMEAMAAFLRRDNPEEQST